MYLYQGGHSYAKSEIKAQGSHGHFWLAEYRLHQCGMLVTTQRAIRLIGQQLEGWRSAKIQSTFSYNAFALLKLVGAKP